jgi:hypothetical protein
VTEYDPGPWTVEGEIEQSTCCCASEYRVRIVGGKAAEEIAQVLGEDWKRKDNKRCSEEAHANARLIAAAPDLLEVLKEYRLRCSGWTTYSTPGGIDPGVPRPTDGMEWQDWKARADAVIAKAQEK